MESSSLHGEAGSRTRVRAVRREELPHGVGAYFAAESRSGSDGGAEASEIGISVCASSPARIRPPCRRGRANDESRGADPSFRIGFPDRKIALFGFGYDPDHSPGERFQLLILDNIRRHRVNEPAERPDPDALVDESLLQRGHIDAAVQLDHADGPERAHVGYLRQGRCPEPARVAGCPRSRRCGAAESFPRAGRARRMRSSRPAGCP